MWYRDPDWHATWWGWCGWIVPLLLLLLLAAIIVWAVVRTTRQQTTAPLLAPPGPPASPASRSDAAIEQARMRYARGDIDRDQFLRVVRDLSGERGLDPREGGSEPPQTTT
ncbi:MAG: hypothetical protein AB1551_08105 [Actinomycetota bacterium]